MPKALVVDDGKKYLAVAESFIRLKEQLGDVNFASQDAEKLLKSGITQLPQPIHEVGGVYTPESKPKKWIKPKSLKEVIRDSQDPRLKIYQRLLNLWPSISNSDLERIITQVDREIITKVLDLVEIGLPLNKLAERFFSPKISASDIYILDSLTRFYKYLYPRYEKVVRNLRDDFMIDYQLEVDGRVYKFKCALLFDGEQVKLDFYQEGHRKVVGIPRSELKCAENLQNRLEKELNELKNNPSLQKIDTVRELIIDAERIQTDLIKIDPKAVVTFPPEFNRYKTYISEHHSPFNCSYCGINHHYLTVIKW
jgi:hypothetical protein